PQLAPRTYPDMLQKYTTMSKAETEAKSAKQGLTQEQKNLVGQTFNILGKAGIKDKNTYLGALDDLVKTNPAEARPSLKGYTAIEGPLTNEVPMADYMFSTEFKQADIAAFQKFFDLFSEKGIFSKRIMIDSILYKG
ncbi:MAG: hypothetical protein EBW73_13200, partial [Betaproteobacteria bacterium]|nr:hypothetical protein [Betaproteobacteria bacterium]